MHVLYCKLQLVNTCVCFRVQHLQVQVSSLFVAGWAGLTVNALNLLPTGELDGGRIALSLFGRR